MKNMKVGKIYTFGIVGLLCLIILNTPAIAVNKGDTLYTAYNLWLLKPNNKLFLNYKYRVPFIPVGTPVVITEVDNNDTSPTDIFNQEENGDPTVTFKEIDTGRSHTFFFRPRFHPGTSFTNMLAYTFSGKDFDSLTKNLKPFEINAIREGTVVPGMSKDAVLISYGYPPEHQTPTLKSNSWKYWASRTGRYSVEFNHSNKVVSNGHPFHDKSIPQQFQDISYIKTTTNISNSKSEFNGLYEKLKLLKEMHDDGLIDDLNYQQKKKNLLKTL
ncbi:MAG: SHOCT domain-containing protein [Gammaproteobacteria bacterium]|nr:SHOCT domain-containing protein [Gammaproteobacteria bacterium]